MRPHQKCHLLPDFLVLSNERDPDFNSFAYSERQYGRTTDHLSWMSVSLVYKRLIGQNMDRLSDITRKNSSLSL